MSRDDDDPGGCSDQASRKPDMRTLLAVVRLEQPRAWAMQAVVQQGGDFVFFAPQVEIVVRFRRVCDPGAPHGADDPVDRRGY